MGSMLLNSVSSTAADFDNRCDAIGLRLTTIDLANELLASQVTNMSQTVSNNDMRVKLANLQKKSKHLEKQMISVCNSAKNYSGVAALFQAFVLGLISLLGLLAGVRLAELRQQKTLLIGSPKPKGTHIDSVEKFSVSKVQTPETTKD
jgi:hypothetical protein